MKSQKSKLLLLHILLLCGLALLVLKYVEEIQMFKQTIYDTIRPKSVSETTDDPITLYPVEINGDEWFVEHPLIYHAGGAIKGNKYTNSVEAVENTLSEGKNFIEIDLRYTCDNVLVCAHNWDDIYLEDRQPTLEEFLSSKIQGKFSPLTAEHLIEIMRQNTEMYLITDIKDTDLCTAISDLVALAEEDPAILDRFIIQLYTSRKKTSVQEIYPFKDSQFLFTTYNWGDWQLEVAKICNEENIAVITVPYGKMPDEDAALMRDLGFTVYEYTVDRADKANFSLTRGISGFYTDTLSPDDLEYESGQ